MEDVLETGVHELLEAILVYKGVRYSRDGKGNELHFAFSHDVLDQVGTALASGLVECKLMEPSGFLRDALRRNKG